MKPLVIFKSVTGFTRRYAEIISEKLGADLAALESFRKSMLDGRDTVLFGGCCRMGTIKGLKKFLGAVRGKNMSRIAIFAVGGSPAGEKTVNDLVRKNFPDGLPSNLRLFYLKGGVNPQKLPFPLKGLMSWVVKMVEKNPSRTPDEQEFLEMFRSPSDFVSAENAEDIVTYAR